MDDNTCPNCKQTAGIGVEVKHLDTCPHVTGDHSKIKEYGHVCHLCSVYLPGSMSRQLCCNNELMSPEWRAEQAINNLSETLKGLIDADLKMMKAFKDFISKGITIEFVCPKCGACGEFVVRVDK
jgi:hypothetical protein